MERERVRKKVKNERVEWRERERWRKRERSHPAHQSSHQARCGFLVDEKTGLFTRQQQQQQRRGHQYLLGDCLGEISSPAIWE